MFSVIISKKKKNFTSFPYKDIVNMHLYNSAMTSTTSIRSLADNTSLSPSHIIRSTKPQLLKLWNTVNPNGFQHVAKADLQIALVQHLVDTTTKPETSRSPQANDALPSTPLSDATAGFPPRIASSPAIQRQGLQNAGFSRDEHERVLKEHGRKLEELDRLSRRSNLILYNLKEGIELGQSAWTDGNEPLPEEVKQRISMCYQTERLGRLSTDRSRPLRIRFDTEDDKHRFLQYSAQCRKAGVRIDDDLTPLQQHDRKDLSDDFGVLKAKGHKPFFRGSELKSYSENKMHTCSRGRAGKAPPASTPACANSFESRMDDAIARFGSNVNKLFDNQRLHTIQCSLEKFAKQQEHLSKKCEELFNPSTAKQVAGNK